MSRFSRALWLAALVSSGCVHPPGAPHSHSEVVAVSCEGRPIECHMLGSGALTVLILATIHGNEPAGTPLVSMLREYLVEHPRALADRRVILMPTVNVDGMARRTRYNRRGVDLNRNFPARNRRRDRRSGPQPLSEPESRAVYAMITSYRPGRIVSIHQPLRCIDFDGPARNLAMAMSRASRLPVRKLGGKPGSVGSYAGEDLGAATVTVELPPDADRLPPGELWRRYGAMLLQAISYPASTRVARPGRR